MIDFEQISLDDYFRKNVEFRMWLMQRKRISLDQLKDRKDRERYFKRFMRHWNDGELQGT